MYICRALAATGKWPTSVLGPREGGGETAKGGWGGWTMGPGPWIWTWTWKRELDAGAGRWALGGLVAADPVDKRASERGSPASILNLSRLAAV